MMAYVVIKTIFILSAFAPVSLWTKDLNRKGQQSLFGDETRDLENRPYKTHKADLGDDNYTETNDNVTLQNCTNNTIENNGGLWLKNCTNNSMNEEEVFGNCTKNCIECKDQKCKGCEIGFYGQNCHLSCLLDCGVDGCYQFTGKCQVSDGNCEVEIDFKMKFASFGLGFALAIVTSVCIIVCYKWNQLKKEIRTKYIKKEPDNISLKNDVKYNQAYRQQFPAILVK